MILLISLVISGLFAWTTFGNLESFAPALAIPFISGILACLTFVIVFVSYFVAPLPQLRSSTYINYLLTASTLLMLVIETGGYQSAYLSLFLLALPLASLLGAFGVVTSAALFAGFVTHQYLMAGLTQVQTVQLSIIGGVAVLIGFLLWSRAEDTESETKEDKSYHELASQLSQMAGKSEVVINAIGDGVVALSSQGVVQLINPAAEQLTGWQSHDALNLNYKSVIKLLDSKNQPVEDINNPIAQALANNKPEKNDDYSIETRSGKSFLASISVSPVGQPGDGVIMVFRDITTEKSDERQRAEFISTASHEMRTPVASIEGYLGLVLNPKIATIDEKSRDYITKAHASAQHLGRLFADLLDVSKADDSRLKNDPKVVDVVPFVHDIVEGLSPKAVEKGLVILYKPLPDGDEHDHKVESAGRRLTPVFYANVDNDHLREVVQNLVENAIKYTPKGEVTIDVTGDEAHVVISVTDTGIGIPHEDQGHLFQKFYRVDNSDTREIGGTGLGLYLCRKLTETIGGRIWVESEYQHGSTFFVEIPRIGHDEATRLIEQASIEAERAAQLQSSATTPSETSQPLPPPPEPQAPPAFDQVVSQAPVVQQQPSAPQPIASPAVNRIPITTGIPVSAPDQSVAAISVTSIPAAPVVAITPPVAPAAAPVNTPLSAIEANPSQYTNNRRSQISIPQR